MPNELQFVLYSIAQEDIKVKVAIKDETIWVTQRGMAELFDVNVSAVSKHLANIYAEGELSQAATVSKMEIVQTEGTRQVTRLIDFYNLDAVISVGYRVNSHRATQFRIWATSVLKEFIKLSKRALFWMTNGSSKARLFSAKTISANFWKGFAPFVQASAEYGSR